MMGRQRSGQKPLFYAFNLDDHDPAEHLLRGIDRCLDLSELRGHLAPFYSHTERSSIDPELMVQMLIVGCSFGIRSERRLCEEVHLMVAYRWFCRPGLEDTAPERSTFSRVRHPWRMNLGGRRTTLLELVRPRTDVIGYRTHLSPPWKDAPITLRGA